MELFIVLIIVLVVAYHGLNSKENFELFSKNETDTPKDTSKNSVDDYSIYMQPTPEDPFMNNENDVLKVLPKFDNTVFDKVYKYSNNYYKDASDLESLNMDRTFITYPQDDQQAFMDFLGFGGFSEPGLKYEDLRAKRR